MALRTVTGTLEDISGNPLPFTPFTVYSGNIVAPVNPELVIRFPVTFESDSEGVVSFDIYEGDYHCLIRTSQGHKYFRMTVEGDSPINFKETLRP